MSTTFSKPFTYDDYASLPEGSGYELVGGQIIREPAPGTAHQRVVRRLAVALTQFVTAGNLGEVLFSPIDVYFTETETYQPDIVFVSSHRLNIIGEKRLEGPPDVVMEVLSPSTGYYDLTHKKNVYERAGVKEYWIVTRLREQWTCSSWLHRICENKPRPRL